MARTPMSSDRWSAVEAALDRVLDAPAHERARVLDQVCGVDAELRKEVEAFLAAGERPVFFDTDAASYAAPAFLPEDSGEDTPLPERLGKYRLVRKIGAGGMSRVFLAEREGDEFHQKVAVKLLRAVGLGLDEGGARFRAERQILASLEHPSIARVFDGGTTEAGLPYLVMEYVDGRPITTVCRERGLALGQRLELFERVCDAVAFAHSHLVVHRDLKPSNILVTEDLRVKLLDFGIAKLLDPTSIQLQDAPLTRTGLFLLTPEYAAPEQLRGEAVTTATDVYALGVLLYELLTTRRPRLHEPGPADTGSFAHAAGEPSKPSTVVATGRTADGGETTIRSRDLAGDLDTIVLKALREEPEDRYRSVDDLEDDLRRYRQGRPIEARPATLRYRVRKFVARNRLGVAAGVIVAGALALGAAGTLWQARQAREEARRAQAVGDFLVELFEGADPELRPGESITALELLEGGADRLDSLAAGPAVRVDLKRVLGQLFGKIGETDRAAALLRSAHLEAQAKLGAAHALTDETRVALGRRLGRTGDPAEAQEILRAALETARDEGRPPLELADRMTWLAQALVAGNAFDEAESLLLEAIAIREREAGPDSPALGDELLTLGRIELQRESFAAAKKAFSEVAEVRERHLGVDHADVARALWELSMVHGAVEEFAEAEAVIRRVLSIRRALYPAGHPNIARTLGQLANILTAANRLDEAEALFAEAIEAWQERFGRSRIDLAEIYANAGVLAYRRGDLTAAAELTGQALAVYRAVFSGEDHSLVASCLHNLGIIERDRGNSELALALLSEGLEIRRRLFDGSHMFVALSLGGVASLERDLGDLAAAEALARESETIFLEKLGAESPRLAEARMLLASVLVQQGGVTEAQALLESALAILSRHYPDTDVRVAETHLWLGVALARLDRAREARPRLETAHANLLAALGPKAPATLRAREELRRLAR